MNHVIQFPTNNCTAPHQILMQNTSLARIAIPAEHITNTNIPLYLYNQPINNFNQNTESGIKTEKIYNCPQCPKKFAYKQSLINHEATHTYREPYACIYCKKKYSLKKTLAVHIQTKHEGEKTYITQADKQIYSCSYCAKKYAVKTSFDRHLKTKHPEKRPYICSTCNKDFSMKSQLDGHIKTHTEEKLYTCEMCDKKYKTRASLSVHVKKCYPIKLSLESFKDADSLFNIHEVLYSPDQKFLNNTSFSMWAENI
jgi:uncharacterized Zn-finger protein